MSDDEWEGDYGYDDVDYDYDEDEDVDYERHVPIDQAWRREPPRPVTELREWDLHRLPVVIVLVALFAVAVVFSPQILAWSSHSYYEDCLRPYCEDTYCETGVDVEKPSYWAGSSGGFVIPLLIYGGLIVGIGAAISWMRE